MSKRKNSIPGGGLWLKGIKEKFGLTQTKMEGKKRKKKRWRRKRKQSRNFFKKT